MSTSFVAELRKLADQAAEETRREEAMVHAEQLRVKREAAVAARTLARQILIEQRKKEQEAEEERQRKLTEEAERKRKIREEKALQSIKEKQRKEEAERVRRHQLKVSKLCRGIYVDLAVAAWDGHREVRLEGDVVEFDEDLLQFGIEIRSPKALATALNKAMIDLVDSMEALSKAAEGLDLNHASRSLRFWSKGLRVGGHKALGAPFTDLLAPIQLEIAEQMQSIPGRREQVLAAIDSFEEKNSRSRKEIRTLRGSLETAQIEQKKRESALGEVVAEIRDHIEEIGPSFLANLPEGLALEKVSFAGRAAALRIAYSTFISKRPFASFTDLEIINLMRVANRLKPISLIGLASWGLDSKQNGGYHEQDDDREEIEDDAEEIDRHPKLVLLNRGVNKAEERIGSLRKNISCLDDEARSIKTLQKKLQECRFDVERFEKILASNLENVESEDLRFIDGQYVGPTFAKLGDACPEESLGISPAYRELTWLSGEPGKDFCGYLDIVLSELAKEGARSVLLTLFESKNGCKVEVGKVSLVCSIGHPLLGLLFTKRGFTVEVANESAQLVSMKLSW